jgi:peptide/nickel transport system substrate-binding protein
MDYWQLRNRRVPRRAALKAGGALAGLAGLTAAGCSGSNSASTGNSGKSGNAAYGNATVAAPATQSGVGRPVAATAVPSTPSAAVKRGGTLKMHPILVADDVWDPHISLTSAALIWEAIGNQTVHLSPDGTKLFPELAQSWEIPGDGTQIILHTRPNVSWHNKPPTNGRKFTADDLAFNINRIAGKLDPSKAALFQRRSTLPNLDMAKAIDDATVQVKLTAPSSGFMTGLADFRNNLAPRDFIENAIDNFKDATKLVGTGPFTIDTWDIKGKGSMKAVPNNWQQPLPNLDGIELIQYSDPLAQQTAFAKGDIDFYYGPSKPVRDALKALTSDYREEKWIQNLWAHFRFNLAKPPFNDVKVRRAVFMALDYKNISDQYFGPGYWDWSGPLTGFKESIPAAEIAKMPGFNPDTKAADRKTASDLLSAAGYPNGKGLSFKFLPASNSPASGVYDAVIRAMDDLKKLWPEINVSIDPPADAPAFAQQQVTGNFDVISYGIGGYPDAVIELEAHYGSNGSRNYGKFSDPSVDAGIAKATAELDVDKRKQILLDVQKTLIDLMPIARYAADASVVWYHKFVKGAEGYGLVTGTGAYDVYYNLKDAWLQR